MKAEKKRKKFKFIYKVLIVFAVFIGALVYFSGGIRETIFGNDLKLVDTRSATLPIVTMEVDGNRINSLNGYVANLDEMIVRESITPLTVERTFTVKINEHESHVRKLKYEVFNLEKNLIESGNCTVLDTDEAEKSVRIELLEKLETGVEYVLKLTLITNDSKRIYYYTRLKLYEDGNLTEKLEFVDYFHETLLNRYGNRAKDLEKYLEPKRGSDNTSFAHVDIHSSLNMVSYGGLEPKVVYELTPTVTEFYDTMASVIRKFVVDVKTDLGTEYYMVTEKYRFNYSKTRTSLYNYERDMEELFDINNFSLAKREFKLGITNGNDCEGIASPNKKYMAFVYNRDLIVYDIENNTASMAFTFKESDADYERDYYDSYRVKLLRCNDNGTLDFCVYGYMNRGEYEGRVGIVLYRYYFDSNAKEERLYMPVNSSYQVLLADMTDFAYLTEYESFYFSIYENIYCYDLITGELTLIADDVPKENLVYCKEDSYIAWQNASDLLQASAIRILHLESGEQKSISVRNGQVRLFGKINNNIIYGFSQISDVARKKDGSIELPAYMLSISDRDGNVLKTYNSEMNYITGVEIGDNIIRISRVTQNSTNPVTYKRVEDDTILNKLNVVTEPVEITKRVTDRMLTEYYVSIPGEKEILSIPRLTTGRNIVINHETAVRVSEPEERDSCYYAYSFGDIVCASKSAAEAIKAADENVGSVINRTGKLIWERGVKSQRREITGVMAELTSNGYTPMQAALKILVRYRNQEADAKTFDYEKESAFSWLSENLKPVIVDMTGVSLDEALYQVYKKRPVIALMANGDAVVITAYDATTITVFEPTKGRSTKYNLVTAEDEFKKAGNVFISYVD